MKDKTFKAIWIEETTDGQFTHRIVDRSITDLPEGEVLIKVNYSSLNYKDALSFTGNKGVTRQYPHTPGIDAVGTVAYSATERFEVGDSVIVTGYDLGMNTAGGFGAYVRVPESWVVKRPDALSEAECMMYGTAGFTAALSVYKLINNGIKPHDGKVLVTGATGGVGSTAVRILSHLGYDVTALTGKSSASHMLTQMGANEIILRDDFMGQPKRPMIKGHWAGVVDTVGGEFLEMAIRSTKLGGCLTCCGNVISPEITASIYPFILRGITLIGITSASCPMEIREEIWRLLSHEWQSKSLHDSVFEITLDQIHESVAKILKGQLKGRTIINLSNM